MSLLTRIAIIGCGAVTERFHLPPLVRRKDCSVTALVDLNTARTEALGRFVPEAVKAKSGAEVLDRFDAAIVAVPHFLHAPVSIELLRAGKSVLIEKPMALSGAECEAMLEAARAAAPPLQSGKCGAFVPQLLRHEAARRRDVWRNRAGGRARGWDFRLAGGV